MLKKTVLATTFLWVFSSQAAIAPKSVKALEDAYDVLTLPETNQKQVAMGKADTLYPALIRISRSSEEPMQTRWRALTLAASLKSQQVLPELEQALNRRIGSCEMQPC